MCKSGATPASLLKRLRLPGDAKAWERFVELYSPLLFYWARRVGAAEADAADLVQDVFAILVRKLPEFEYDPHKGFRGWLRTVTVNRWRETLRKHGGPLRIAGQALLDQLASPSDPSWDAQYHQLLSRRALEGVRDEFQPATWRACWLCAIEGRPAAEVGQQLKMSAGAVRAAKFRVLARVRQELEGLID
jgi:RNA polymerase sigma-70 factor, ECF subfamily